MSKRQSLEQDKLIVRRVTAPLHLQKKSNFEVASYSDQEAWKFRKAYNNGKQKVFKFKLAEAKKDAVTLVIMIKEVSNNELTITSCTMRMLNADLRLKNISTPR